MEEKREIGKIIVKRLISLILFFAVLIMMSLLMEHYASPTIIQFVHVLNSSIILIVAVTLFFILGEIFAIFKFPFSLLSPAFNAPGAIFLAELVFKILKFASLITGCNFISFITPNLESRILFGVFWLTLIFGFIIVLSKHLRQNKSVISENKESKSEEVKSSKPRSSKRKNKR